MTGSSQGGPQSPVQDGVTGIETLDLSRFNIAAGGTPAASGVAGPPRTTFGGGASHHISLPSNWSDSPPPTGLPFHEEPPRATHQVSL